MTTTEKKKDRVPSDETLAIRVLRDARRLHVQIATAKATLDERQKSLAELMATLTPGAKKIFDLQMGAK